MTDKLQLIQDDLAYMKALAAEGRQTPLLSGAILMSSGLIWAATSLFVWAVWTRLLALPLYWGDLGWPVGGFTYMVALILLVRRHRGKPGHNAVNNRVMAVTWSAGGWGIFTFVLAVAAVCWRVHSGVPAMLIAPFVLVAYGVCWIIAAGLTKARWLFLTGLGSFAAAVALGFMANTYDMFLAYAAALLLLMALPGYILMRQEPSEIV